MSYSPEDRAKFVLWFTECPDSYAPFAIRVRQALERLALVPKKDTYYLGKEKGQ